MIRLLRRWFWRRDTPAPNPCRSCDGTLKVCPACQGAWTDGCQACRLGQVCSTCATYWI